VVVLRWCDIDITRFTVPFCCIIIAADSVGTPQRVNGKVEGTVRLSGKDEVDLRDIDLHSYVVVNDGRAYTAMSRIEENVGYAMQPLSTIGGIIGWLFGLPQANAVNGYTLTGEGTICIRK